MEDNINWDILSEPPQVYFADAVGMLSNAEIYKVIEDLESIRRRRGDEPINPHMAFIQGMNSLIRGKPFEFDTFYSMITKSLTQLQFELNRRNGRVQQVSLDEIKNRVPIKVLVERYVGQKNLRKNIACCLPGHNDGTASLNFNEKKNMFYCFGCHKGGTQIDFIKEMEGCDTKEAIKILSAYL